MKKIFRIYQKNFRIYDIFPGKEKNFPEITVSCFQKCPLGKNAILMTFFTQEKGTLLPEKGHLAKLGGGGSYAPGEYLIIFRFNTIGLRKKLPRAGYSNPGLNVMSCR
jgi:hypothetical protein